MAIPAGFLLIDAVRPGILVRSVGRAVTWLSRAVVLAWTLQAQAAAAQEPPAGLAGDYFAGASVFLFQRTVLAAYAPAETPDPLLDAGAIVLARENAQDEGGAVALEAMEGWLTAWYATKVQDKPSTQEKVGTQAKPAVDPLPGFSAERRRALSCLVYGADPQNEAALAQHAGLGSGERDQCIGRYAEAAKKWDAWLEPYRKTPGVPPLIRAAPAGAPIEDEPVLRLAFAPTIDATDQAIADAMRKNGLFQLLTDNINRVLTMPRPVTGLLTQCGEARAFYNPDRGEAVLCYELLAGLLNAAP
jgi:hypothetical protein